jgi:hypothetical protein
MTTAQVPHRHDHRMSSQLSTRPTSAAVKLNVAGLLTAAVGIVIQIIGGVDYPTVPPGLIMLGVAAAVMAFVRWRWIAVVGVVVPLFLLVGGARAATFRANLSHPAHLGAFTGTVIQTIGVLVALGAGVLALRKPSSVSGEPTS